MEIDSTSIQSILQGIPKSAWLVIIGILVGLVAKPLIKLAIGLVLLGVALWFGWPMIVKYVLPMIPELKNILDLVM